MRGLALLLGVLLVPVGPLADAGGSPRPKRFSVSLRAGGFDEQGRNGMQRKDGEPGNPVVGWKGSEQVAVGLGFDLRPGLTLDLSLARLEIDIGTDLVAPDPGEEIVSTQIATGDLEELRLALWIDTQRLGPAPTYFGSAQRATRGRVALAVLGVVTRARDVVLADSGREALGVEDVTTGRQASAGLGARMDYRLGDSSVSIGADLAWMWKLSGELLTVDTSPDSLYTGTVVEHEGLTFLVDLSYRF